MKARIEEIDGKHVAILEGEMNTAASAGVEQVLKPLYTSDGKDVIIDCSGLEYIASSGLRILLGILKGTKAGGNSVTIRHANDDLMNVFRMTGFVRLFKFDESPD